MKKISGKLTYTDWDNINPNLLVSFLKDNITGFTINANDTFGYACADSEEVDDMDIWKVMELYAKYGFDGVNAFMAHLREYDVLKPLQTKEYLEAKRELKDFIPFHKQLG